MARPQLAKSLAAVPNFVQDRSARVDGVEVPIAPFYVEYAYTHPGLFKEIAEIVTGDVREQDPDALAVPEAAMLPVAALVAADLHLPVFVVRKPEHPKHEEDEPLVFGLPSGMDNRRIVLVDDAIWSCRTLSHACELLHSRGAYPDELYVMIDITAVPGAESELADRDRELFERRSVGVTYREVVGAASERGVISSKTKGRVVEMLEGESSPG